MTEVTKHDHGMFSWVDVSTTDQQGAKDFYTKLFGWTAEDMPVDENTTYTMFRLNGKDVAACSPQQPEHAEQGVPPMWNSYVTVEDVDQVAKTVEPAGGRLLAPPFDVMDAGRMAVVMDPTGGALCLWQAKESIGAQVVSEANAFSWNELMTADPDAAKAFYSEVLGWTYNDMDMPNGTYTVIKNGDKDNGGIMKTPQEGVPTSWTVYFTVDDADEVSKRATDLGAKPMMPVDDFPGVGRIGWFSDPQGAVFAVIQPANA